MAKLYLLRFPGVTTLEQGDMRDTSREKGGVPAKADLSVTRKKKALSFLHKACSFSRPSVSKKSISLTPKQVPNLGRF